MTARAYLLAALVAAGACVESAAAPVPDASGASADARAPDAAGPDAEPVVCVPPPPTEGDALTAFRAPVLTITADGAIDEPAWALAHRVAFDNPARSDNQVTVYALWDEQALYFAYEVTDGALEAVDGELHLDDGGEIYVDTEHDATPSIDADDYHFIGTINDMWVGGNISSRTAIVAGGYTMEIAIPWQTLALTPTPDATYGLLLGNNDRDLGESAQFDWRDLIESGNYDRPNLWGDLVLSPQACSD